MRRSYALSKWPLKIMIKTIKKIICKIFGIKQCACNKTKVFLEEGI